MSELDAEIRERMKHPGDAWDNLANGYAWLQSALLAVLDLHKPTEGWRVGELVCTCLPDPDDTYMAHAYPCPTVRAIAEKLSVEVGGG